VVGDESGAPMRMRGGLPALLLIVACAGTSSSRPTTPLAAAPSITATPSTAVDPANVEWTALQHLVAAGLGRLRPCYQRELARDPAFESKMAIQLFVTPAGQVADMTLMDAYQSDEPVRKETMLNDGMAHCLGTEVMTWVFPGTTWEGQVQLAKPPIFVASFYTKPIEKTHDERVFRDEKEKVRHVIRAREHEYEYKACYEAYLARGGAGGLLRVKAQLRIRNDGSVETADVLEPPALEIPFRDCIVGVLRALAFGKLPGEEIMIVEYPFVFQPQP
jgi:hypothetical protein